MPTSRLRQHRTVPARTQCTEGELQGEQKLYRSGLPLRGHLEWLFGQIHVKSNLGSAAGTVQFQLTETCVRGDLPRIYGKGSIRRFPT
jgi:hypothetical protein